MFTKEYLSTGGVAIHPATDVPEDQPYDYVTVVGGHVTITTKPWHKGNLVIASVEELEQLMKMLEYAKHAMIEQKDAPYPPGGGVHAAP